MQRWIWVVMVVAACKGSKAKHEAVSIVAPKVTVATVLAKDAAKPPFLVLVDGSRKVRIAAAKSWADLDANKLQIGKRPAPLDAVDPFIREEVGLGREPIEAIGAWDKVSDTDIDLAVGGAKDHASDYDPPPPPPEDVPDDRDESGGTGTQMALDEAKMGKGDADRAEGQYKMKKADEPVRPSRGPTLMYGFFGDSPKPREDGTPTRVAQVEGAVMENGTLDPLRAMLVVAPTSKATALIEIVRDTRYAIAVSHDGHIRPLRLQFDLRDSADVETSYWLEARVSAKGIVIEAVPDKPIEVSALDQLGPAIAKARTARGAEAEAPVDVLVDAGVDTQRLIDVLVALDTAGVRTIGMGATPSSEELARRGHRIPTTVLGRPNAQGDLDKALIRRVVKENRSKIAHCYEQALATEPTLAGTVEAEFFITPKGTVSSATVSGVDPTVDKCVEDVMKALTFPAPHGGGGVQVNYPFTMQP